MIATLVRRDGALRSLPILGLVLLCNAGLLLTMLAAVAARGGQQPAASDLAAVGWISVAVQLLVGARKPRGGPLELALPIPGRTLWLARVAALALSGAAVAAGFVLIVALVPIETGPLGIGALLLAATALAAVLLQARRPGMDRTPPGWRGVVWSTSVVLALLAVVAACAAHPGTGAMLLLAACGAALAVVLARVPPALAVFPREPGKDRAAAPVGSAAVRRPAWTALLRCVSAGGQEWLGLGALAFFGLILGGVLTAWGGDEMARDARFLYVAMGGYILYAFVGPRLNRLTRLDPLPASRRLLFAAFIVPSLLVLGLSYGAGALLSRQFDRTEFVDYVREDDGTWRVSVPLRTYHLSRRQSAPVATAPWGESHPGSRVPLIRGGRTAIETPYVPGPGASARFVAWQVGRAAEEVYGFSVPEAEILAGLETLADGTVAGRAASLGIRAARPGLLPRSGPIFPAIAALVCLPWLLLAGVLFAAHRAGAPSWARQAAYWGGLALLLLLWVMGSLGIAVLGLRPWAARALIEIPMWELGRTVAGTALAWAGGGVLVLAAYLLAQRAFCRMEIPARPTRYSLLDRLREEEAAA